MTLELKHLAAYLPNGLKIKTYDFTNGFYFLEMGLDDKNTFIPIQYIDGINSKPILRPLSDLDKQVEVNGQKFIPIDEIYKIWYEKDLSSFSKRILLQKICIYTESMPYWLVQKLLEWHFDIFGLIESGLAIDINNLKP